MSFGWEDFGTVSLIGTGVAAVVYCVTRWGRLNANGQYDQEVVAALAWKAGVVFALIAPVIYLLFAFGIFK